MTIDDIIKQEILKLNGERNENTPSPQEVADNLDKHEHLDGVLANVNIDLVDQAWKNDVGFYIGKNDGGIGYRREKAKAYILNGNLKHSPYIDVRVLDNEKMKVSFGDGRHRFATFRDLGVKTINITFGKPSAKYIHLFQK